MNTHTLPKDQQEVINTIWHSQMICFAPLKQAIIDYRRAPSMDGFNYFRDIFNGYILRQCRSYYKQAYYYDLIQVALIGLLRGITTITRLGYNGAIYNYIKLCIKGDIMKEIKNIKQQEHSDKAGSCKENSSDEPFDDIFLKVLQERDQLVALYENIKLLPMNDFDVIMKVLDGKSFSEIGREINKPAGTISKRYQRAIKHLQELAKNEVDSI